MRRYLISFSSAIALATFHASASAQDPATPTVQQQFDAAAAKQSAGDAAGALANLDALRKTLVGRQKPSATNIAIVEVRRGDALAILGRVDEAREAYAAAVSGNGLAAPAVAAERDAAYLALGRLEELAFDHAEAGATYLKLLDSTAQPITRLSALVALARVKMFVDAPGAMARIDEALALVESLPGTTKEAAATVLAVKGRILLNDGRNDEASKLLRRAVDMAGGLTMRVNVSDVAVRSDAALAEIRLGNNDRAREYLAYTGAGRTEQSLPTPYNMALPPCGGAMGLRPDDTAIVQFAILPDGTVTGAHPVVASRQGDMAYHFARAIGDWSWNGPDIAKIPALFRAMTRVEVRCSTHVKRPGVESGADAAFEAWLLSKGVDWAASGGLKRTFQRSELMTRLERAVAGGDIPTQIAAEYALAQDFSRSRRDNSARAVNALRLIQQSDAPAPAILAVALDEILVSSWAKGGSHPPYRYHVERLKPLLDWPMIRTDPQLRATVMLKLAEAYGGAKRKEEETAALRAVIDDPALNEREPLKITALVMLANVEAQAKRLDMAQALYARTGLSAAQCALIDGGPRLLRWNTSSDSFPEDAMRWGFEGWTALEYDIAADGRPANARTIASFPPLVFVEAGERVVKSGRFSVSYRPEGGLACAGALRRIVFGLP